MPNLINEIGNKYGRLTVIERAENKNGVRWRCRCECGKEIEVLGTSLRSGNTKSCGCLQKQKAAQSLKNLVGQKFGKLTVIKRDESKPKGHGNPVYWICQCDCGNVISIRGTHLKTGHTISCGCYLKQKGNHINEIGNKYGKLTVIEFIGTNKEGNALWRCSCDCGNEKVTTGKSLRKGLALSCGCLRSKGEEKLSRILTQNNVAFIPQYHTETLKSDKNYPLYFDFYLPDYNTVIEYQGEQHYNPISRGFYDETSFEELKRRDELKKEWCKTNKIKMIEIPYTDFDKINFSYIKEMM